MTALQARERKKALHAELHRMAEEVQHRRIPLLEGDGAPPYLTIERIQAGEHDARA